MTVRGIPAPQLYQPGTYWEDRAQRFAGEGAGLAAVCAYGMPEFYNRAIQLEQRLALRPWLDVEPGTMTFASSLIKHSDRRELDDRRQPVQRVRRHHQHLGHGRLHQ